MSNLCGRGRREDGQKGHQPAGRQRTMSPYRQMPSSRRFVCVGRPRVGVGSPVCLLARSLSPPGVHQLLSPFAAVFYQRINLVSPESARLLIEPLLIRFFRHHASSNSKPKSACYHFRSLWRPERHKACSSSPPKGPPETKYRHGHPEGGRERSQPRSPPRQTNSQSDSAERQVGRPLLHSPS